MLEDRRARARVRTRNPWPAAFALLLLGLVVACSSSRRTTPFVGRSGPPVLGPDDDLPGLVLTIHEVTGGTGPNGAFRVGDVLSVRYSVALGDGTLLDIKHLARGAVMVSGPTFNYQRVIASQGDLVARSVSNPDGSYTYKFNTGLPETYLPPINDSPALTDGELTGQPLLSGTYTVGMEVRVDYVIDRETFRDTANATADFLFGSATTIERRDVVRTENCNQCHQELRAHGGNRTRVEICLLCHTAGAEDLNNPAVEGGTPGVSIEFQTMIHRIHAGATLPSVVGVTTAPSGARDYSVEPKPYKIVGFGSSVHDYSHVRWPMWPSLVSPMPRDVGYDALDAEARRREDLVRSGPVDCAACHGDPDGAGPLEGPANGDLIWRQPTRRACTSCHDDWLPEHPYTANMQTMPPQRDDGACTQCHRVSGTPLDVMDAHRHPLRDPELAPGLHFVVKPPENLQIGDKLVVRFSVQDDRGEPVPIGRVGRIEVGVTGPTSNPNLLLSTTVPVTAIQGTGPEYETALPERVFLERVGTSTNALENFSTARKPHWHVAGALTEVYLRTATGSGSILVAAAPARQNFIDVLPGTGAGFARDQYVVIEPGVPGQEEVLQIQFVEGDRLWFSSPRNTAYPPALTRAHPAMAVVRQVTVTRVPATSFAVHPDEGRIEELVEFGEGDVLVTYSTDFVIPERYPGTFNDSPDLDEAFGDWVGLPLLSGTYTVGVWGTRGFTVNVFGQTTNYTEGSIGDRRAVVDFLVGSATKLEPNRRIDSAATCNACHVDLQFHGGNRRGYDVCMMCHGTSGAEDRARHLAANAPATPGVSIEFRSMLHKIHAGSILTRDFDVVGQGSAPYPNNFSVHNYNGIGFPVMPGGVANCVSCHGSDNDAWHAPAPRVHPLESKPSRTWFAACITCHDSDAARAHAEANTSPRGAEACAICHGPGEQQHVVLRHKVR